MSDTESSCGCGSGSRDASNIASGKKRRKNGVSGTNHVMRNFPRPPVKNDQQPFSQRSPKKNYEDYLHPKTENYSSRRPAASYVSPKRLDRNFENERKLEQGRNFEQKRNFEQNRNFSSENYLPNNTFKPDGEKTTSRTTRGSQNTVVTRRSGRTFDMSM